MLKTILLPSLLAILLSSCAMTGPAEPQTRIVDNSCALFKPVYVSKTDVFDKETADAILANNLTGASHCGWKPKKATVSPQ